MARIRRVDDQKEMEQVIDDFITQGYKLKSRGQQSTMMKEKTYASAAIHIVLLVLTFWPVGIVNAIYLAYAYFTAPEVQIKVEPPEEQGDGPGQVDSRSQTA